VEFPSDQINLKPQSWKKRKARIKLWWSASLWT